MEEIKSNDDVKKNEININIPYSSRKLNHEIVLKECIISSFQFLFFMRGQIPLNWREMKRKYDLDQEQDNIDNMNDMNNNDEQNKENISLIPLNNKRQRKKRKRKTRLSRKMQKYIQNSLQIETILQGLLCDFRDSIECVAIVLGSSIFAAKEGYFIWLPSHFVNYIENEILNSHNQSSNNLSNEKLADLASRKLLRTVISELQIIFSDRHLGITNGYILIGSTIPIINEHLLLKNNFSPSKLRNKKKKRSKKRKRTTIVNDLNQKLLVNVNILENISKQFHRNLELNINDNDDHLNWYQLKIKWKGFCS